MIKSHLFRGGGIGVRPITSGGVGTPVPGVVAFLAIDIIMRSFAAVGRFSSNIDDDKEDRLKRRQLCK